MTGPDAAPPAVRDAAVTLVDAGIPDRRLYDLLTHPDKVEAFSINTSDFSDAPAGSSDRLNGYRIVSRLGPPASSTFISNLAALVLSDGAYRRGEAVKCALGPAVGIRWTRGVDVAETDVMPPCPSVDVHTTFGLGRGGQLEGGMADKVFALVREAYPKQ